MWAVLHRSDAIPGSVGAIENTEVIMSKFLLATALLTVLSAPALAAHLKAQPELMPEHHRYSGMPPRRSEGPLRLFRRPGRANSWELRTVYEVEGSP